jgi:hypothetical protein
MPESPREVGLALQACGGDLAHADLKPFERRLPEVRPPVSGQAHIDRDVKRVEQVQARAELPGEVDRVLERSARVG